ncbi:MAG: ATP-dependent DNA helicase [Candidatus Paceibacterota bacterium]
MDTFHYTEELRKLNKEQRKAVETIDGPVIVVAGPGTGKTQVLTTRIAHILHETDTPPHGVLALTFTDAGVQAMRARLKILIGKAAHSVEIATFHGFANSITQDYPDSFPKIIGARQIDELEKLELLQSILDEEDFELLKPLGDPHYYLRPLSSILQDIKREGFNPESFQRLLEQQIEEFESIEDLTHTKGKHEGEMKGVYKTIQKKIRKNFELLRIYQAYELKKAELRLFDYDDAILELLEGLKHDNDLLLTLQERYLYILVDEHQDSNGAQNRIIDYLSNFHENPNLFIVGDDKQAIYRFQGASLKNFLFFSERYPSALMIELTKNYRSHQSVLDISHTLIQNNPTLSTKPLLQSLSLSFVQPRFVTLSTEADEAFFVAKEVRKQQDHAPDKSIAILYRNNTDAQLLEAALRQEGILYTKLSGTRRELHPYTEQFLALLSLADSPSESSIARALLYDCFKIPADEAVRCIERARNENLLFAELSAEGNGLCEQTLKKLMVLRASATNTPFFSFFENVLHTTGLIESIVRSDQAEEALEEITQLHSLARNLEKRDGKIHLRAFITYVEHARTHNLLRFRSRQNESARVTLSTVHGVKGLEFDSVIITGLDSKKWGGKKKRELFYLPEFQGLALGEEGESEQDERRLLYVGMTRAKESLLLTVSASDDEGRARLPTRFIDELGDGVTKETHDETFFTLTKRTAREKHTLLDKEYVASLFLGRQLNATAVNKYLKCPWEYYFLSLLRLPQASSPSAKYGTAVHHTLQHFFEERNHGIHLSDREVRAVLQRELEAVILSESEKNRFLKKGEEHIIGYLNAHREEWGLQVETERSYSHIILELPSLELKLSGKLDKIEREEDGLIVTDFKTGKPKSRNDLEGKTKTGTGDYKRQLVFYAELLERTGESMKEGVIDFVEPNERGIYKQERFIITQEDRAELIETIRNMSKELLSGSFVDKGCTKKTCEWCRLSRTLF